MCFAWFVCPPEPRIRDGKKSTGVGKEDVPKGALEAVKDTYEWMKGNLGNERVGYLRLAEVMIEDDEDQLVVEEMELVGPEVEGTVQCVLKRQE